MIKLFASIDSLAPIELEDFSTTRNVHHLEDDKDVQQFFNMTCLKNTNMDVYFPLVGNKVHNVRIYGYEIPEEEIDIEGMEYEEKTFYESTAWNTILEVRQYLAADKMSVRSEILLV